MASRVEWDRQNLTRLLEGPDGPVAREVARRTIRVESGAKRLCPVDTGRLRASITHTVGRDGQGIVGTVGTNVTYAVFVELGTRHMAPRPYLRPALAAEISRGGS